MKIFSILLRLLVSISLIVLLTTGNAQQNLHPSTSVDYKPVDNGTPKILVHLDEKTTANLLLDSGASECLISEAMKIKFHALVRPFTDSKGSSVVIAGKPLQLMSVPCLQVALIRIEQCPFVILPFDIMKDLFSNEADGLIGTNFLLNYATLFDTQRKKLTFWPDGDLNADDLKSVGFEDATVLPVTFGTDGLYRVRVRFNDREEEEIALDTGAALTNLPIKLVRKLKLKDTAKGKLQNTLAGIIKINMAHLQTLMLGKLTLKDLDVQYSNAPATPGFFPHIGMDVLSHFRFLLDAPAKKLYLKPIETTPKVETPKPNAPDSKP